MKLQSAVNAGCLTVCMILSVFFVQCGSKVAGSEVTNEKTVVYMPGGHCRAAQADIQVIPVDYIPIPGKTSDLFFRRTTDSSGEYIFTGIPDGFYNVVARKDTFVSLLDSVYIKNSQGIPDDTLEIPGSLSARIKLQPNHNHTPRVVSVQLIGTLEYFTNVDSTGLFTIKNVADGTYQIRLEVHTYQGYTPTFRTIRIRSAMHDTIDEPIELIYNGIPVVTNLQSSYDAKTGVITVSWDPVNYSDFNDYAVFRDLADSELSSTPVAYVKIPVFSDTIKNSISDSTSILRYMYRVAVRNSSLQKGETFKYALSSILTGNRKGLLFPSDTLNFNPGAPCSLKVLPDPVLGKIKSYFYSIGPGSQFVSVSGPDTLIFLSITADSITSNYPCVAKVITEDGVELTDTLYLQSQLTWKKISESPSVNSMQYYSVPFKASIFLFTSNIRTTDTIWSCWSSIDGITWKAVNDTLPLTIQKNVLVFKDKLWVFERRISAKPVIWSSEDGSNWVPQDMDSIPGDLYSTKYEVWTTWGDRLVLVNYYPLCLDNNSCYEQVVTCWVSSDGSDWRTFDLNKSVFPDRYDKPNTNFAACDLNGSLCIGGAWRALGLKSPPWTAYSFRVWSQATDDPQQISFPVPVDTNTSFNELKIKIVIMKGKLFLCSSVDPDYMWVLMEDTRWVKCSSSYPGGKGPNTCVMHNETLFSISNEGVWKISKEISEGGKLP